MKKAFTAAGTAPTEGMREFGRYLQRLRAANEEELEDAVRENRKPRVEGKDRCFQKGIDDRIPDSFRAKQQLARRLGVRTKSLREVAAALGISKNTVHEYEMGTKYPSAEFVYEFCAVLQKPADPAIQRWVEHHPNPIVARHVEFGHFNRFVGRQTLSGCPNLPDPEVRKFIQTAIVFSVPAAGIRSVGWPEAWALAWAVAMLMDLTLLKGGGPDHRQLRALIDSEVDPESRFEALGFDPFGKAPALET